MIFQSVGRCEDDWFLLGRYQFDLLRVRGLEPHHTVLDVGCASFRLGIFVIPYLDAGNYYGIDIREDVLELGINNVLKPLGLLGRAAHLRWSDVKAGPAFEQTFDYVWSYAVLDHIGPERMPEVFATLSAYTGQTTRIFATAFLSDSEEPCEWTYNGCNFHGVTTYRHQDPHHNHLGELVAAAELNGLRLIDASIQLQQFYPLHLLEFGR